MTDKNKCEVIKWFDQLDSTNLYFETATSKGLVFSSRNVIVADFQTAGKGNGNNAWESEAGKNLLYSVYYESVGLQAAQQFYLNMAVALGVVDCVAQLLGDQDVSIKWPNDIYVGKRKIAGMLIKHAVSGHQLSSSVLGIGLNVNQQKFLGDAPNPVSLIHLMEGEQNRKQVLEKLLISLDTRLDQLEKTYFNKLKSDYLQRLYAFKNYKKYLYENKLIEAKITGVSEFGSLQLEVVNGDVLECDLKEIRFVL